MEAPIALFGDHEDPTPPGRSPELAQEPRAASAGVPAIIFVCLAFVGSSRPRICGRGAATVSRANLRISFSAAAIPFSVAYRSC